MLEPRNRTEHSVRRAPRIPETMPAAAIDHFGSSERVEVDVGTAHQAEIPGADSGPLPPSPPSWRVFPLPDADGSRRAKMTGMYSPTVRRKRFHPACPGMSS